LRSNTPKTTVLDTLSKHFGRGSIRECFKWL
jgi:hypothetical protein